MQSTGKDTASGFLPAEPSMGNLMERLGFNEYLRGESEASRPMFDPATGQKADLQRAYVSTFATPAGQKVLEDLLDMTLRRASGHPNPDAGIEQEALYARERRGQNSIVAAILKNIHDGQKLPAPNSRKKPAKR